MSIRLEDGNVGIGTLDPGTFKLAVNGTAAKPGGGSWSSFSDSRLKMNIQPMTGTLERLLSLHGYTFEYKQQAVKNRLALAGQQIGLLAEEVECVFPDWVDTDAEGYRYVTERATTALMVEALRDLRQEKDRQIAVQQSEIVALRSEFAAVRAEKDEQITELMKRLAKLESLLGEFAQR